MRKNKENIRKCYVTEKWKFNKKKLVSEAGKYSHEPNFAGILPEFCSEVRKAENGDGKRKGV